MNGASRALTGGDKGALKQKEEEDLNPRKFFFWGDPPWRFHETCMFCHVNVSLFSELLFSELLSTTLNHLFDERCGLRPGLQTSKHGALAKQHFSGEGARRPSRVVEAREHASASKRSR